jgi:glutamate racemase
MTNQLNQASIASQPIGIFDSGIGGLTVAHALVKHLPHENIIYFGDTAHLPYGDKSTAAIQAYAVKIAHLLIERHCKLILIACNSASAAAYELVKEYSSSRALVMNVIDPVVQRIGRIYPDKEIGLIGTRQTVNSSVYQKKIAALNVGINLYSQPTNLLASAIEEFGNHDVVDALLDVYLGKPELQQIDALVLACTHYPIVKQRISDRYDAGIDIIDPSDIVAEAVKQRLGEHNLLNLSGLNGKSERHFYVSDYTPSFEAHAKLFFGEEITLEHYPLWD